MEAQAREIDGLNKKLAPFRLLKGVEVNIRADGTLDVSDEELAAATGSSPRCTRRSRSSPTERICAAMENPHVDCIGHPTTRKIGRRGMRAARSRSHDR